jgi:hypothetical protein
MPTGGAQHDLRVEGQPHDDHQAHDAAPVGASHGDMGHHDEGKHHPGGESGKCTLCSACCSSASLLSSAPAVLAPEDLSSSSFPDLAAPAPTFLSDGQERPPRSI